MPTSGRWAWRARTRSHARAVPQHLVVKTPAPAPSYFRVLLLFLLAELLNLSVTHAAHMSTGLHKQVYVHAGRYPLASNLLTDPWQRLDTASVAHELLARSLNLEPRFPGTDGEGLVSLFSYTKGPDWCKRRADQVCRHVGENRMS